MLRKFFKYRKIDYYGYVKYLKLQDVEVVRDIPPNIRKGEKFDWVDIKDLDCEVCEVALVKNRKEVKRCRLELSNDMGRGY